MKTFDTDFANEDGNKINRIMRGGLNLFCQYASGIIQTGEHLLDKVEQKDHPEMPKPQQEIH